jgi:hypothetical protein
MMAVLLETVYLRINKVNDVLEVYFLRLKVERMGIRVRLEGPTMMLAKIQAFSDINAVQTSMT